MIRTDNEGDRGKHNEDKATNSMSKPFSILHISDLHRSTADPISNDELISALVGDRDRYLHESPRILPPEAIVLSGDLVQVSDISAEKTVQWFSCSNTSVCGQRKRHCPAHAVSTVCRNKRRWVFGQSEEAPGLRLAK